MDTEPNPEPTNSSPVVGEPAPDFTLLDSKGHAVRLSDFRGVKSVVLFFYPRDETPVCTIEACSFRDHYEDFLAHDAEVLGISSDDGNSHRRFSQNHRLPYVLLTDQEGLIRKLYGVGTTLGLLPGRATFVVDRNGVIRHIYSSQFRPKRHVEEALGALDVLTALEAERSGDELAPTGSARFDGATRQLRAMLSYVPSFALEHLDQLGETPLSCHEERANAAVLFTDIAGFTKLAEELAARGPEGAEQLTRILDNALGAIVRLVRSHGGEAVKFAGDAIISAWRNDDEDLALLVSRAASCACAIQSLFERGATVDNRLSLRIGLGAGEVRFGHLGGALGRWEFLIAGAPMAQVSRAESSAEAGQTVVSSEARALCPEALLGQPLQGGLLRLESVADAPTPRPLPLKKVGDAALEQAWSYVPGAIRKRIQSGQTRWLAELRQVTVLFISLTSLKHSDRFSLAEVQLALSTIQRVLYRHEGSVNKMLVDDKGTLVIGAFGLPPLAHEDDPRRGLQAALDLQRELGARGHGSSIGLTTGRVFCGPVGSDLRREYTVLGDVVNLAARLMQAANGEIYCDHDSAANLEQRFSFEQLGALKIKGKANTVEALRLVGRLEHGATPRRLGRAEQSETLASSMQGLAQGRSSLVLLEAASGMGKSALLNELSARANETGIEAVFARADPIERATPYHGWRRAIEVLLELDPRAAPAERARALLEALAHSHHLEQAPLLNSLLKLELADNELSLSLSGEARADATQALITWLVEKAQERHRLLLVFEDAQWLDSASLGLVDKIYDRPNPVMIVLAARPSEGEAQHLGADLEERPGYLRLQLGPLSLSETDQLLRRQLEVNELDPAVTALVLERCEGKPYFALEVSQALTDHNLISIENGRATLGSGGAALEAIETSQSLLLWRIDQLPPPRQLLLKAASVLGERFDPETLFAILPGHDQQPDLTEHLEALVKEGYLKAGELAAPELHSFRSEALRATLYELMLFDQRRSLHRALALHYESTPAAKGGSAARLAHHWELAREPEKALNHLETAARGALRCFAAREAAAFYERALKLSGQSWSGRWTRRRRQRRGGWYAGLGEACWRLGDTIRCREHLEHGLTELGWPIPKTKWPLTFAILGALIVRLGQRYWPFSNDATNTGTRDPETRRAARRAVNALLHLVEIYYLQQLKEPTLLAGLRALNLAERLLGRSTELASARINLALVASVVPLPKELERLGDGAVSVAEELGDLSTLGHVESRYGIALLGTAQWAKITQHCERALLIDRRLGNTRRVGTTLAVLGASLHLRGDFAKGREVARELAELSRPRHDYQQLAWGAVIQCESNLRLGESDAAQAQLELVELALQKSPEGATEILFYGLGALIHLRLGRHAHALEAADRGTERIRQCGTTAAYALEGYAGVAEVMLELWSHEVELGTSAKEPELAENRATKACRQLESYAKAFALARPRAALLRGRLHALRGERARAEQSWALCEALATELEMPYERALLAFERARSQADAKAATNLFTEASGRFGGLGAKLDVLRCKAHLDAASPDPATPRANDF